MSNSKSSLTEQKPEAPNTSSLSGTPSKAPTDADKIVRKRHGRTITIEPQVLTWRKKMKNFRRLKGSLTQMMLKKSWDRAQAEAWLKTPHLDLGGRSPRDYLNPTNISKLYRWAKKALA